MSLKDELKSIISGTGQIAKGTVIQTVANYIRKSKTAGANAEEKDLIKEQETAAILNYSRSHNFFFSGLNKKRYLAEGAEQKVYLDEDGKHVTKLNGSIFYRTW